MFGYLVDKLIAFFKFMREWITGQSADGDDWTFELPFSCREVSKFELDCPYDLLLNSLDDWILDADELVDSLVNLQDQLLVERPPNGVVKKLNEENIETLNHIINIKLSDLIDRMDKKHGVPFYTVPQPSNNLFPYILIDGKFLRRWLIQVMQFNPDEALYVTYLLSSHPILFKLVNHYLIELNIGFFERYPINDNQKQPLTSNVDYKSHLNDYDYAIYLCKRATGENFHIDLLSYEVGKCAKDKVDVEKWKFKLKICSDKWLINVWLFKYYNRVNQLEGEYSGNRSIVYNDDGCSDIPGCTT